MARVLFALVWLAPCGALAEERSDEALFDVGESVSDRGHAEQELAADTGPSWSDDAVPWFVLGLSTTVFGAGAMMLGLALADILAVQNAARGTRWEILEDAYGRSEAFSIAGFILSGIGLAGMTVGIVWVLVDSPSPQPSAALSIGPGGVALQGTW